MTPGFVSILCVYSSVHTVASAHIAVVVANTVDANNKFY